MKRIITDIVIHCSATPNGTDFDAADIDAMHKARGFTKIGYHFVICINGDIQPGRDIEEIGAHVKGYNSHSIGICMIGLNKFTVEQWQSLQRCVLDIAGKVLGVEVATPAACAISLHNAGVALKGHRDYSPDLNGDGIIERTEWIKDCPNFDVSEWVRGGMVEMKGVTL